MGMRPWSPPDGPVDAVHWKVNAVTLIRQLADRFTVLQEGVVNAERVFKLFDRGERIDQHGERYPEKIQGNIAFENVWFAYNDEAAEGEHDWVIRDLTLQVKAGQTVAFVGATGAGKSSVDHYSAVLRVPKGTGHVDDHLLRDLSLAAIRHHIAGTHVLFSVLSTTSSPWVIPASPVKA